MTKRKSVSKKLRFEIFKRDSFTCQYCGNTPPKVILEVDHIIPVCEGGENDEDNLVTACFDCNRGKAGNKLDSIPNQITDKLIIQKEKQDQLAKYHKFLEEDNARLEALAWDIFDLLKEKNMKGLTAREFVTVKNYLKKLPYFEIEDAMYIAMDKIYYDSPTKRFKYFCGICRNKIGDETNG